MLTKLAVKLILKIMETQIDLEISKNQISFDFDQLEMEEESSTLSLVNAKNLDWIAEEVLFVLVKAKHDDFIKNLPDFKLFGKSMLEWVKMAGNHCQTLVIDQQENMLEKLKSIQTDKKIMAVFYSDTPLLDKTLFNEILNYFAVKGYNALKLVRGEIFKIDYLKSLTEFVQSPSSKFSNVALEPVCNGKMLTYCHKELKKKIQNYHIKNGVVIFDESVCIDADAEIEKGVIIYGCSRIEGQSVVCSGTILRDAIIKDSIIGKNCVVENAYIEKSKISDDKRISAFEKIENMSI